MLPYLALSLQGSRIKYRSPGRQQRLTIDTTQRGRRCLSIYLICLRGHNEIVFVQTLHHVGPPLHRDASPFQDDQRMVVLFFGNRGNLVCKFERLRVIFQFEDALQAFDSVNFDDLPFRHPGKEFGDFTLGQLRISASARDAFELG